MRSDAPAGAMADGTIHWQDLSVALPRGKALLQGHSGTARAGRLLGILGPSGAGKSTLLAALAGTLRPRLALKGDVWSSSGQAVGVAEGTVALLAQDDPFFTELTVRETLRFAAELCGRSARCAGEEADHLLQRVGLASVASQRVGKATKGEQRRLAVACAIAGEDAHWNGGGSSSATMWRAARALLADEPTTGLDAFQAARVVGLLRELAVARRCAAMATLHQPRAAIWRMLDDALLLSPGGSVVYCGSASDILPYFSKLGHTCSLEGVNPAEFLIDLVSIDHESPGTAAQDCERIRTLASAFRAKSAVVSVPPCASEGGMTGLNRWHAGVSHVRAFRLLVKRSLLAHWRDRVTNALRLLASGGLGIVFGAHFGRLDGGGLPSARSVAQRICLVSFGVIAMAMLAMARSTARFAKEKAVVERERAARCYGGGTYLLSNAFTELPMDAAAAALFASLVREVCGLHARLPLVVSAYALVAVASATLGLAIGAAAPQADRAMALAGPVMIVHMLTGVIDPAGAAAQQPGRVMQMLQHLSPIRYAIEALCVAELGGMDLARSAADAPRMGGLALVRTGDEVLRRLGIHSNFHDCMAWLVRLSCLHLLAAAAALALGQPGKASGKKQRQPGVLTGNKGSAALP
eukprot:TRINITY_DN23943_c0_g1_i1.p1 TRINITY_DN23943_c0_g1~~TRINITY_DN23943_c0_g1_i1.p1  ORF type:complete len:639 (+),score=121.00 TRINITY_DN23943_c0_g1_i1:30-1946(+)